LPRSGSNANQQRYVIICPPTSAVELSQDWPAARLTIIEGAMHSALEPGMRRALMAAVERSRDRL